MSGIFAELLTLAKKINNYAEDATGGGLWTTTQTFRVTVPANKRWFVLGGSTYRGVSSTLSINAYDVSDALIWPLEGDSASQDVVSFPSNADTDEYFQGDIILDVGEYIEMGYGTAQNVNSYASVVVLEIEL